MRFIKVFLMQYAAYLLYVLSLIPRFTFKDHQRSKNGVNLISPPMNCGLGFVAKSIHNSLRTKIRVNHIFFPKFSLFGGQRFIFRKNIFVCSPNLMFHIPMGISILPFYKGRNFGLFFWELESPPREWRWLKPYMDEVWVQSDFLVTSFSKMFNNVHKIPFVLDLNRNKKLRKVDFKLPQKAFIFLFNFDYRSFYERKNPEGVVRAFMKAFGNRDDVYLFIKTTQAKSKPDEVSRLKSLIGSASNIELRDAFISSKNMISLISLCDSYISLHRAEGLGLGMAEAMALGKPVIATNYSGNLEFMNHKNSCLVSYKKIPIKKNAYVHCNKESNNGHWADPDINEAAVYMKKIKENKAFREKIADQALIDMKQFTQKNQQQAILNRLRLSDA
jgi:glycosyltransferase involved in cell wall biosynthesis